MVKGNSFLYALKKTNHTSNLRLGSNDFDEVPSRIRLPFTPMKRSCQGQRNGTKGMAVLKQLYIMIYKNLSINHTIFRDGHHLSIVLYQAVDSWSTSSPLPRTRF